MTRIQGILTFRRLSKLNETANENRFESERARCKEEI